MGHRQTEKHIIAIGRLLFIASGAIATALALPGTDFWFLAWIGLIPLMDSIVIWLPRKTFLLSWFYATVYFAWSLSWITHSVVYYGGLNWLLAGCALLILSAFCGLFPAVAIMLAEKVGRRFPNPVVRIIMWPSAWVTLEYIRGNLPCGLGFPWNSLGQTQQSMPVFLQSADWGSFYGLSFVIVLVNFALFSALRRLFSWKKQLISAGLILLFFTGYGVYRLNQSQPDDSFRVGIVQGNQSIHEKWNPDNRERLLMNQIALSKNCLGFNPDLIIWSEGSIPFLYRYAWRYEDEGQGSPGQILDSFINQAKTPLLTGTLDRIEDKVFNAAVLIEPRGNSTYYYKKKLVPFGEYVPAEKILFFVNRMVEDSIGQFDRGTSIAPLKINEGPAMTVTICYENIFPNLVRHRINAGGNFICNITNDAWFGNTAGPFQHFSASRFRAVETRHPVIRCANTGISGALDSCGRVIKASELFTSGAFVVDIHPATAKTMYLRFGDWFAYCCILITILLIYGTFTRVFRKE